MELYQLAIFDIFVIYPSIWAIISMLQNLPQLLSLRQLGQVL